MRTPIVRRGAFGQIATLMKKRSAKSCARSENGRDHATSTTWNLYRHTDSRPTAAILLDVLRQKCAYKAIPVPTLQTLVPHRPALEAMWSDMLSHQLPVLPPLNDFWDALPEIFNWMTSGAPIPQRALIQHGLGETPVRTRVLPMNIPLRSRSNLEIIRFAAANYLCVDLA